MKKIEDDTYYEQEKNSILCNTIIAIILFIALIFLVFHTYSPPSGHGEHYKGRCLLDFTTSYNTIGCLDD